LLSSKKFKERLDFSAKVLGVGEFLNRRVQQLSGGMKRRANLAASLIHDPPLVILDEPTDGFSSEQIDKLKDLFEKLKLIKQ
jgi:ABC-2 type transport system ATP-binding protein